MSFLNGKKLGHTENMHRTWVYQVKELVKEGENLLELHIASPVKFIEAYKPEKGREIHFINTGTIPGSQYIRKAHSMFGWDWAQSFQMRDFSAAWSSAALILQDWANP